jgi:hypothetical protein
LCDCVRHADRLVRCAIQRCMQLFEQSSRRAIDAQILELYFDASGHSVLAPVSTCHCVELFPLSQNCKVASTAW